MFTTYKVLLTLHILAAVIWVGGGATIQLLALRVVRSKSAERLAGFSRDVAEIGMRVYLPASIVIIVTGGWLVSDGSWGFGKAWVTIGLSVWLISALAGTFYLGPTSKKIAEAIEREGVESTRAQALIAGIFRYSRIELALLVTVVCDMVLKPGA